MNNLLRSVRALALGATMASCIASASAATFVGDRTDFRDETIYFAMTTRFYDGDPTNNVCGWDYQNVQIANNDPDWRGDFKGLIDKLDYIKALGFTAIWITPVVQNCSGTDFHGYHAMDFQNVDLRYESRKEWGASEDVKFQDLIDAAHAKGMKIVLDIVLNHTGNFGEKGLQELFYRSQNIKDQASVSASIIPNYDKLPSNYNDLDGDSQYAARFPYLKNTDGQNHDNHNYWHHLANAWNWDYVSRWWGQIAGDCVDLNTENPAVAKYLVDCYGKFIEMGVDGFRIDTTGHISRLTFNTSFIPQFLEIAEQNKDKRLNGCPFFMFGECCQRFQGSVTYRGQDALSSYYYQWKSPETLVNQWNWDETYWDNVEILEGNDNTYGNMNLCLEDVAASPTSDNVLMKDGKWHEPDYSQYSGFSTIDFPSHYGFNNAEYVVNLAKDGDNRYNDASFLVTYVDSHDYCPGPNDLTRFNGGTAQWAENLALMFTFRGIPCLYYGSEVEFKKGAKVDGGGTDTPVKDTGRAYFGNYLEGDVTATDFGEYTASGNVAQTLNADLAQHVRRLNQIRAAVPALRKGQYTFDGCSANGGWAFKRAYKDESYALVALNGGATFSNLPAGEYTDIVTGTKYTASEGGSITVSAPQGQGQVRVLVKGWTGGKVGEDGKFIYTTSPVAHGGNVEFDDPGTDSYYTADDAVGTAKVSFNPSGCSFKTETLTVSASLNDAATSGWYQIGNGSRVNLTPGQTSTFTVGEGMAYGESVTVTWGADDITGKETYRKVDPNAVITVYVKASNAPYIYAWEGNNKFAGAWPGTKMTSTTEVDGQTFYYMSFPDVEDSLSVIFNNGSNGDANQTKDITGITGDVYYEYNGGNQVTELEVTPGPKKPVISANPKSGTAFADNLTVTLTVSGADVIYFTTNGQPANENSTKYVAPINLTETTIINAYAKNEVGETTAQFTYEKRDIPVRDGYVVYFDNSGKQWNPVYAYCWDDNHTEGNAFTGAWPGVELTETELVNGKEMYVYELKTTEVLKNPMIIFNNGNGDQTKDFVFTDRGYYNENGNQGVWSRVTDVELDGDKNVRWFTTDGIEVAEPTQGVYIRVQGTDAKKVVLK